MSSGSITDYRKKTQKLKRFITHSRSRGTHFLGPCRKVKARTGEDRESQGLGNIPLLGSVHGVFWGFWRIQAKKNGV